MKSLSTDTHPHDVSCDQKLYDLLKEASDGPGSIEDDEDKTTATTIPETDPIEDSAKDSDEGDIDASWGENPNSGDHTEVLHFSKAVIKRFREGREELLSKYFDGKKASEGAEKKLMGQHFSNFGEAEASNPLLGKDTVKTSSTLMERVRAITGRH